MKKSELNKLLKSAKLKRKEIVREWEEMEKMRKEMRKKMRQGEKF